mmetsp:Transcript_6924/g.22737  ORF Transcript_6924/g.22737 Transcript_6924/m.22737 type:complete len:236 (-) Transcript_6924:145-852(-)
MAHRRTCSSPRTADTPASAHNSSAQPHPYAWKSRQGTLQPASSRPPAFQLGGSAGIANACPSTPERASATYRLPASFAKARASASVDPSAPPEYIRSSPSRASAPTHPTYRRPGLPLEPPPPGPSEGPLRPDMRSWYSLSYASSSLLRLVLKSSSCAKFFRRAMSGASAGGYWPTQYHDPGASHLRLAGSATHFFDLSETRRTLKMRTFPYREVKTCWKRDSLAAIPRWPCIVSL